MSMNTLGQNWVKGIRPFESLHLVFENKVLVNFDLDVLSRHLKDDVVKIVNDLISQKMITFFDDIPNMVVDVDIYDIPTISEYKNVDIDLVYIETFHFVDDDDMTLIDRNDCDVPKPLHEFMGLSEPIMLSDI